eukprot:3726964-Amphidinium_carterae.1
MAASVASDSRCMAGGGGEPVGGGGSSTCMAIERQRHELRLPIVCGSVYLSMCKSSTTTPASMWRRWNGMAWTPQALAS